MPAAITYWNSGGGRGRSGVQDCLPCHAGPISQVLRYQAGYVACAAVAILYLLAMPSVGLCFWCCRCRRHCGGRVKSEHKALARERGALGTFLLLTTLVLL